MKEALIRCSAGLSNALSKLQKFKMRNSNEHKLYSLRVIPKIFGELIIRCGVSWGSTDLLKRVSLIVLIFFGVYTITQKIHFHPNAVAFSGKCTISPYGAITFGSLEFTQKHLHSDDLRSNPDLEHLAKKSGSRKGISTNACPKPFLDNNLESSYWDFYSFHLCKNPDHRIYSGRGPPSV